MKEAYCNYILISYGICFIQDINGPIDVYLGF